MKHLVIATILLLTAFACTKQLRSPEGQPKIPLEGLWIENGIHDSNKAITILWIERNSATSTDAAPLRFQLLHITGRNLALNDQSLVMVDRKGEARTTGTEVLLNQKSFKDSRRSVANPLKEKDPWNAANFAPEIIDVAIEKTYAYDILELDSEKGILKGSDGEFYRAANGYGGTTNAAVWRLNEKDQTAHVFLFQTPGQTKDMQLRTPGSEAKATLLVSNGNYGTVRLTNGSIKPGDALVPIAAKPGVVSQLTREQILEKVRRGEAVSREDLLRAMGDQKPK
ncbi:MAG: hypothetical protein K8S54_08070 [Spirochaetia bacterium]|nr:hypothetical protein [Spirochaetia bacterium]